MDKEVRSVFEFEDFRTYLNHVRMLYPGLRKPITLDQWARRLKYRSPRSIAMVLKGQRLPSDELITSISIDLKHSESERRYLELLVKKAKYKDELPGELMREIEHLNPKRRRRKPLEGEIFSYVSDWYHYVILQLVQTPGFMADVDWIWRRLGKKISRDEIIFSLELLEKLGFVVRDKKTGSIELSVKEPLITGEDIPSAAGRRHLREQMDQARLALDQQALMEREFSCLTLRVDRKKLPEIKKAIREFRDRFDKEFFDDQSGDVCQLNLQFFFHTIGDAT